MMRNFHFAQQKGSPSPTEHPSVRPKSASGIYQRQILFQTVPGTDLEISKPAAAAERREGRKERGELGEGIACISDTMLVLHVYTTLCSCLYKRRVAKIQCNTQQRRPVDFAFSFVEESDA